MTISSRLWLALALMLLARFAGAETPAITKDFWRILVRPHKPWTVKSRDAGKIVIETYDVHKVGVADVARLRWTFFSTGSKEALPLAADDCRWTHVAVTDAGLYLLKDEDDDAAIAKALAGKPSRSSPPKPYRATKQNKGRKLRVDDGRVCWGWENVSDEECDDTCEGEACASPTAGIVYLDGTCAPDFEIFDH
jgi:hypothetical protein